MVRYRPKGALVLLFLGLFHWHISPMVAIMLGTYFRQSGSLFYTIDFHEDNFYPQRFGLNRGGSRGDIAVFSDESRARMRRYLRECSSHYRFMFTLTYPFTFPTDGTVVKGHLDTFFKRLRRRGELLGWREPSHFWFLEFQSRGAPHIHILSTHELGHKELATMWYEVVGSDDERHLHAGTRVDRLQGGSEGAAAYACKYAEKAKQKEVPEEYRSVGRFWGVRGHRGTVVAATFVEAQQKATNREISDHLMQLRGVIADALKAKTARIIKRNERFFCVKLSSLEDICRVRWILMAISCLTRFYNDIPVENTE